VVCPTLLTLALGVLRLWEEEGDPGGGPASFHLCLLDARNHLERI